MNKRLAAALGLLVLSQLIAAFLCAALGYKFGTSDGGTVYAICALMWLCVAPLVLID